MGVKVLWRISVVFIFLVTFYACKDPLGGLTPPPQAPQGLTVIPGDSKATLSWESVEGAGSYNLYWSSSSGVTPKSGTRVSNVTTPLVQSGLANGVELF